MHTFSPFSFLMLLLVVVGCATPASNDKNNERPVFSFGVVADAQYADKEAAGARFYRSSITSLDLAAKEFNTSDLKFVVHLGDIIDEDFSSYDDILPIYDKIEAPHYIVLGNHEFSVEESEKDQVASRLGLAQRYYDFVVDDWRFIALDGQGMSTFAPSEGTLTESEELLEMLQEEGAPNAFGWNGGIDKLQFEWLKERLDLATKNNESVILFCHFPTYPLNMSHNLWNDGEVTELLSSYPVVKAWFNGHNHAGYTGILDGIHFVTFKGMVNHPEENAYAIAHVYPDQIVVEGKGAEDTRIIPIRGKFDLGK